MTKNDLKKVALPEQPGVYFFIGARKEILYIGKATNLRQRVRSYFAPDLAEKRSELIAQMVSAAHTVDTTVTDSVLEALILETNLIRTHKPRYNTRSKDNKSYNHLVITNEEWPRVLVVRGKDLAEKFDPADIMYECGPFPSSTLFREALKLVRRLFQFYDTKERVGAQISAVTKGKLDFNRQIGLYPNQTDKVAYNRTIRHLKLFFTGEKAQVIAELEQDMMAAAKREEFEVAAALKKRIFALKHIQDISLIKDDSRHYRDENRIRIEAYDIAHLQGSDMVGVMTVVEGGEPTKHEYRKFAIKSLSNANDPAALREVLARRLRHAEWPSPQLIVVDGNSVQKSAAERVLKQSGLTIPVVAVVKNDKHKPERLIGQKRLLERHQSAILLANAESHRFAIAYHRQKRRL